MASWLDALRGRQRHAHQRLHTQEDELGQTQDERLAAAFGSEEDEDAPELTAQDVRIQVGPSRTSSEGARSRPGSPAPAYDSSLTDNADMAPRTSQEAHHASWRDRLTSVVRYGRVATSDSDAPSSQAVGSGVNNDGVFANLVAKPEAPRRGPGLEIVGGEDGAEKEIPPSYDIAAADAAPPYWETTIIAPQGYLGPDSILVDGLPVGNLFGFAWNLLVSMSFQFVGFLLTYLLHTSHAAKNGSRAGLGITLIQWAFYMRQRAAQLQGELEGVEIGAPSQSQKNAEAAWAALWGGQLPQAANVTGVTTEALQNSTDPTPTLHGNLPAVQQVMRVSSVANTWLSYILLALGSALIVGALLNYWKAIKFAATVRSRSSAEPTTSARALIF